MNYQVVFTSKTGNTKKIAEVIYISIDSSNKSIYELEPGKVDYSADVYFVGFWINRGSCSIDILNMLSDMHGKKIALFGTCGSTNVSDYYKTIESEIDAFIPDDSEYLGMFLCQGKMPVQVREKYEELLKQNPSDQHAKAMIENFDNATNHPDSIDLENAKKFVKRFL